MIDVRQRLQLPSGASGTYYSLPALEKRGVAQVSRLPVSLRILLESVLRNLDGRRIRDEDVEALARWQPRPRAQRRCRSSSGACCFRTSPACRCSSTSRRCARRSRAAAATSRGCSRWFPSIS